MRYLGFVAFGALALAACQTTGSTSTMASAEAEAPAEVTAEGEAAVEAEAAAEGESEKQSLDAMLDEHEKVTLLDDDTGETRLICRRVEARTGSRLGSRKLCATRKEWREREQIAKQEIDRQQRSMDASCPSCN